jgi:hypothetical protein
MFNPNSSQVSQPDCARFAIRPAESSWNSNLTSLFRLPQFNSFFQAAHLSAVFGIIMWQLILRACSSLFTHSQPSEILHHTRSLESALILQVNLQPHTLLTEPLMSINLTHALEALAWEIELCMQSKMC